MKGMKSFGDIIDATNQALDEFNSAFDEAGQVIEKRRKDLDELIAKAEKSIDRLEELIAEVPEKPKPQEAPKVATVIPQPTRESVSKAEDDKVEVIKRHLAEGKSHEEISRLTGASIREVKLVEKFTTGR